jgi:hypothetical protein
VSTLESLVAEVLDEWDYELESSVVVDSRTGKVLEGRQLKDPKGKLDAAEKRAANLIDERYLGKSDQWRIDEFRRLLLPRLLQCITEKPENNTWYQAVLVHLPQ